ncbi:hypothetical protein ACI76O_02050 [Capnocytophaga cynodegmi]|uniref:hypothetical protein n=1 Tax=Capnocytophaga cynodegmi TaxID=28189 RepID=UPI00385932EA
MKKEHQMEAVHSIMNISDCPVIEMFINKKEITIHILDNYTKNQEKHSSYISIKIKNWSEFSGKHFTSDAPFQTQHIEDISENEIEPFELIQEIFKENNRLIIKGYSATSKSWLEYKFEDSNIEIKRETILDKILKINELCKIKEFLVSSENQTKLREELQQAFLKFAHYQNATEWNTAVRICECLAIIGWGDFEPLEALRGKFYNGNSETYFLNEFGEERFITARWSKRKTGTTISEAFYQESPNQISDLKSGKHIVKEDIQDLKLETQRNWIAKNPIRIRRIISNCYENSRPVIDSLFTDLQPELNRKMRPQKYGKALNYLFLECAFSYADDAWVKTNYIITKTDKKLSSRKSWKLLHELFSAEEIKENGYFLRNRFEIGTLRKNTGKAEIVFHFEKEFSQLSHSEQKQKISDYFLTALRAFAQKQKKIDYDFDLMLTDFEQILKSWLLKK